VTSVAPCWSFTKPCHAVMHSLQTLQKHGEVGGGTGGVVMSAVKQLMDLLDHVLTQH
jgi:hypothetical protein